MTSSESAIAAETIVLGAVVLGVLACLLGALAGARGTPKLLYLAWALCAVGVVLAGLAAGSTAGWVLCVLGGAVTAAVAWAAQRLVGSAVEQVAAQTPPAPISPVRDELTGFFNAVGLASVGPGLAAVAKRDGDSLSALVVEPTIPTAGRDDHDELMLAVAEALQTVLRSSDIVARREDDSFVALAKGPGLINPGVQQRIQDSLDAQAGHGLPVPPIAVGSAQLQPWDDGDMYDVIDTAHRAAIAGASVSRRAVPEN